MGFAIKQTPNLFLDLLLAAYRVAEICDPVPFILCRYTVPAKYLYYFICI